MAERKIKRMNIDIEVSLVFERQPASAHVAGLSRPSKVAALRAEGLSWEKVAHKLGIGVGTACRAPVRRDCFETGQQEKTMSKKRTQKEVRDYILNRINEVDHTFDWDDFTSIRISDPWLDAIRLRCLALEEELPEFRNSEMMKIVDELNQKLND